MIAVIIAVNLFIAQAPTTLTKFDTTNQQLFTFSAQTTDLVGGLSKDVKLYLIAQSGKEDKTVTELLDRYKALSDKLTVETVDPVMSPKFVSKYTAEQLSDNSVIVESGDRNRVVKNDEIFVYDYSNYYTTGQADVNFDGESAVTSAIDYVTSEDLPIAYTLEGHGEAALPTDLTDLIAKENITVNSLSLLSKDAVPEDADVLIINAPTSDLGEDEAKIIQTYLENGGHLLLTTNFSDKAMPNLASLMGGYGVEAVNGIVVEGDQNHSLRGYSHYLVPVIGSHEITSPLTQGKMYVLMPVTHGIRIIDSHRSTLSITSLLTTSDSAYSKPNAYTATTLEKEAGDENGPFDLGVAISESYNGKEARLVWFGTSQFLDSSANQMVGGGNFNLFLNSLNWMASREDKISIRAKSLMTPQLTVPSGVSGLIGAAVTVLIPLIVIGIGIIVFVRRRKR
jgi:ABC-2 type transport system permease protein